MRAKLGRGLGLGVLLAVALALGAWVCWWSSRHSGTGVGVADKATPDELVGQLHEESAWSAHRWEPVWWKPHWLVRFVARVQTARFSASQKARAQTAVDQAELQAVLRREGAEERLARLGTNAWPVVPALVELVRSPNASAGLAAGSVLARNKAEDAPAWGGVAGRLRGQKWAVQVFLCLLNSRNQLGQRYDMAHRRLALLGLAATGAPSGRGIPEVLEVATFEPDHELRAVAVGALATMNVDPKQLVPLLTGLVQNVGEWPDVRAAALSTLAVAGLADASTRPLLRQALQDEKALVRLTAARVLWQTKAPAAEVLPTLTALLSHKLVTIRVGALNALAEMGPAAQPARAEIARLAADENESVRRAAAVALRGIGSP